MCILSQYESTRNSLNRVLTLLLDTFIRFFFGTSRVCAIESFEFDSKARKPPTFPFLQTGANLVRQTKSSSKKNLFKTTEASTTHCLRIKGPKTNPAAVPTPRRPATVPSVRNDLLIRCYYRMFQHPILGACRCCGIS